MNQNKNQFSNLKRLAFYWIPVIFWAGIMFSFSAHPTGQASKIDWQDFVVKKTAHMVEYGLLTLLLYRAFTNSGLAKKTAAYYSIIFSVLYGFTDEFHQSFTPGREPALRDVIFDTIGSILAIYFIWKLLPKMPKKLKRLAKNLQIH